MTIIIFWKVQILRWRVNNNPTMVHGAILSVPHRAHQVRHLHTHFTERVNAVAQWIEMAEAVRKKPDLIDRKRLPLKAECEPQAQFVDLLHLIIEKLLLTRIAPVPGPNILDLEPLNIADQPQDRVLPEHKSNGQEEFGPDEFVCGQRVIWPEPNFFPMMPGIKHQWVPIQKFGPGHTKNPRTTKHAAVVDKETKQR